MIATDFDVNERYLLQQADNALILGHRLSEWCGHGPVLEQDIALTNIALDLIGLARNYYQYAAEIGNKESEDFYPYLRTEREFFHCQLVELPNQDFGYTIVRQFLFDSFHLHYLKALTSSGDKQIGAIAQKSLKEAKYHYEFSRNWILRLGDGTPESHRRVQAALNDYFPYAEEMLIKSAIDVEMEKAGIGIDLEDIAHQIRAVRNNTFQEATLTVPQVKYWKKGGKEGVHTEYLGRILAEMQYIQKTYPGAKW